MTRVAGVDSPRQGARPFAVAVAVTVVLMLLSAVVAFGWRSQLQGEGREEFDLNATEAQQLVVQRLQSAIGLLQDTQAEVDRDPSSVTGESFERAVAAALPEELPSLATVSLVERVGRGELARLTA